MMISNGTPVPPTVRASVIKQSSVLLGELIKETLKRPPVCRNNELIMTLTRVHYCNADMHTGSARYN